MTFNLRPGAGSRDRLQLLAASGAGAATVLGFAPFGLFPVPLLTVALLIGLWQGAASPRRAARSGFLFGLGYFLAGVSWVYVSLHQFGGMAAPLAAIATVLFCAYLALFPALAGWLYGRLRAGHWLADALLAAAAWTGAKWLRGWLFTGFPWLALGYAQTPPSPLAGLAPLAGVFGVGFASVLIAALIATAWQARRRLPWSAAAIAAVAALGFALGRVEWTRPVGEPLEVSLLQGNIEQSLKWKPERLRQSMDAYLRLAQAHPARLVVLPETALPLLFDQVPPDYLQALRQAADGGRGDVLLGSVMRDGSERYYNSAVGLGASPVQTYSKRHLVPFGEFTPPAFQWTLALLHIPMSNFSRGAPEQPVLELAGQRVAVNICYEDLFGEEIIRALPEATLLVNLSNTAWFGDSLAQPQHLQIARMRSLETGRPMLRATNTGMTAMVGARGEVAAVLEPFTEGALTGTVTGYSGTTPFVRWGNGPVVALSLGGLLGAALRRRRERRTTANSAPCRW
ncbi:MAG: apolipoprotein N-acyltransferase [Pseudomonadota bacterium]